ncbi:MAG: hypothetical protein ACE5KM_06820 [Planctomycetaceae bacterium]
MAACEQGYLCDVCGEEVETITQSDLYLRFVIGETSARELPTQAERHIGCNPTQAQFIVDPDFEPVVVEGPFDKRTLDPADVRRRENLVTRGWKRLREIHDAGLPLAEYPLPEFRRSIV